MLGDLPTIISAGVRISLPSMRRAGEQEVESWIACHQHKRNVTIPVLVFSCHYGQLLCQCAGKSLNQSIILRMEGCGAGLVGAQLLTHGCKHTELKVPARLYALGHLVK